MVQFQADMIRRDRQIRDLERRAETNGENWHLETKRRMEAEAKLRELASAARDLLDNVNLPSEPTKEDLDRIVRLDLASRL